MASVEELKRYIEDRIKISEAGCWEWQRGRNGDGYGQCRVGGRGENAVTTHRLAYRLWRGPIGVGLVVRHQCHNPPCCNPEHLILGTHEDNTQDIRDRGKKRRVFTDEERQLILEMRRRGEPVWAIATTLKTDFYAIKKIVLGLPGRSVGRPKGSKNVANKVSDDAKAEIVRLYMAGGITQQKLAERFNCDQTYVSLLIKRSIA